MLIVSFILQIIAIQFNYVYVKKNLSLAFLFMVIALIIQTIYILRDSFKQRYGFLINSKISNGIKWILILQIIIIVFNFKVFSNNFIEFIKFNIFIMGYWIIPYYCIFIYLKNSPNKAMRVIKIYILIVVVNVYFALIQFSFYELFKISLALPYQVLERGIIFRPAGFLGEPAHLGVLILPILSFSRIMIKKQRVNIILATIILFLSGSTVNLIVALLLSIKLIFSFKFNNKNIIFIITISIISVMFLEMFPEQFQRHKTVFEKDLNSVDNSTVLRIYKGPIIFRNLPIDKKITGVGIGNEREAISYVSKSHYFNLFSNNMDYFSGVGYELVILGIVIMCILNIIYYKFIGIKNLYFFIGFELMRIGSSISYNSEVIPMFIVICFLINKCKKSEEICNEENNNSSRIFTKFTSSL